MDSKDKSTVKASVIILVWNGMAYLEACLNAVLAQDYPDFEVIVVDNGSADGSADFVAAQYAPVRPQVRPLMQLIRNARNLGFAAGNNIGLRAAVGDVLVLLNQDTEVRPGWLAALVAGLQLPGVGMVGSKAYYPDGRIQHAGGQITARGEGIHYGYRQEESELPEEMREVDYVTGASLALSRQVWETVGGLDEGFSPAYFEDVDWCWRVKQAGWRVMYAPQSCLVHKESSSAQEFTYEQVYRFERNRLRFVLKHWPLPVLTGDFLAAERAWLESWGEGAEALVAAVQRAYLYHLLHLNEWTEYRQALDKEIDAPDQLAQLLLTLRAALPLRSVRQPSPVEPIVAAAEPFPPVVVPALLESLPAMDERWAIRERPFESQTPVIGPWIAAFRQQWNSISTQWYVRPLLQQQTEFNALTLTALHKLYEQSLVLIERSNFHTVRLQTQMQAQTAALTQLDGNVHHLGEGLSEYIRENGREIAELAQALSRLEARLEQLAQKE